MVKLKCYYKPVGAFFERPPVFVNDPYEQENGLPALPVYCFLIVNGNNFQMREEHAPALPHDR